MFSGKINPEKFELPQKNKLPKRDFSPPKLYVPNRRPKKEVKQPLSFNSISEFDNYNKKKSEKMDEWAANKMKQSINKVGIIYRNLTTLYFSLSLRLAKNKKRYTFHKKHASS